MTGPTTSGTAFAAATAILAILSWTSLAGAQTHDHAHAGHAPTPHAPSAESAPPASEHAMHEGMHHGDAEHAQHQAAMARKDYTISEHRYPTINASLVDMSGSRTTLRETLGEDRPVILTFIFTTCTTICPVLSGTFTQLQSELGPDIDRVRMVSISIDPEYDTPERLRDYAARFKAGPQWQHLTGDPATIVAVQKSFDVYRGNKMSHEPIVLLRRSIDGPWIRINGLPSAKDVGQVYRGMMAASL
jgi:protein SCO1/2